jgi:translation initiation factor IF-2
VIYDGKIGSLKRFKEDVREVQTGYECGIMIENFNDIKVGDIFEDYVIEKIATKLES